MKLKKQVTVCGAAVFCVAVFSLYLMLDRVQHDPARHQSGGNFPRVSPAWCLRPSVHTWCGLRLASGLGSPVGPSENLPSPQARKGSGEGGR